MSRLESFIRRMDAQRRLLNEAMAEISDKPGVVLELGLGNGRTYDHLRENMPGRDIFVFEREVRAHPDCIPPDNRLYLGHVIDQLQRAARELGPKAVLVHSDVGNGHEPENIDFGRSILAPALKPLLAPGARILSDQPLPVEGAIELEKPADMDRNRYYIYRYTGQEKICPQKI
jgi:hypothetical protein